MAHAFRRGRKPSGKLTIIGLFVLGLVIPSLLQAQVSGPPWKTLDHRVWPSPHASISQVVGVSTVTLDYGRPAIKGREIWGGLVPYGRVWRLGADENTVLTLSEDATVEGQHLAAGRYGVFAIPSESSWTIAFSRFADSWGHFSYQESEDVLRVEVAPRAAPTASEWLTFRFDDPSPESVQLVLHWDRLEVPLVIAFATHDIAIQRFEDGVRSLSGLTGMGYANAARYCLDNETHLEKGLEWAQTARRRELTYDTLSLEASLLDALGRSDEAEPLFEQAAALATSYQLQFVAGKLLREDRAQRLVRMFEIAVVAQGDGWSTRLNLAKGLAAIGRVSDAREQIAKALEMAPPERRRVVAAAQAELEAAGDT